MPMLASDLFLIEDPTGASKKIEAGDLLAGLAAGTYDNYKLLVNKPDYSSRYVLTQNMQSGVADDDWMMVERSGQSYKVSGTQVHDYFPSVPTADCPGPIVDINSDTGFIEPQVLTLASMAHVDELTDGDPIVMTDGDSETAREKQRQAQTNRDRDG